MHGTRCMIEYRFTSGVEKDKECFKNQKDPRSLQKSIRALFRAYSASKKPLNPEHFREKYGIIGAKEAHQ